MSAVLTPSTIWTSPMMCSLCWTQASTRSLWNRLSLMQKNLTQLPRQTCPVFFEEYERLMQKILDYEATGKKFNFFHFMLDLDQGPVRSSVCVAAAAAMSTWQSHRTATSTHVISLSVRQTIKWATWTTAHSTVK